MSRVLFILKYREVNDPELGVYSKQGLSSGLFNSARMVNEMLNKFGLPEECESKLVQAIDNNCIDKFVTEFKPDVVIIEAFWVVPEKFDVLRFLHPKVKWLIRNHSNIPFLAQEGQIIRWIDGYIRQENVFVATNTKESLEDLRMFARQILPNEEDATSKVLYFPNYYMTDLQPSWVIKDDDKKELNIGCFGAIRPLKNNLEQAFAALRYAEKHDVKVNFHINIGRFESGGQPIIHNLRAIFANAKSGTLIEHTWVPHADFVKLVGSMDLSMQVSFSETFNIVTADAVMQGVPVVGASDVAWIDPKYWADPTRSQDIVEKMEIAFEDAKFGYHNKVNQAGLESYNQRSLEAITSTIKQLLD